MNKELDTIAVMGELTLYPYSELRIYRTLKPNARFSFWLDQTNFSVALLKDVIGDIKEISYGETKEVILYLWDTNVTKKLRLQDIVKFGVQYDSVGEILIKEFLDDIE